MRPAAAGAAGRRRARRRPPGRPLAELVGELADQQRRLDLLDAGGDPRTAVRAVFSWSYRQLDAAAARAFRLLGLHPGPDLDAYAAAALTGTSARAGRPGCWRQLARAHLIQPAGPGRYGMHDLLRAYARELAAAHDATRAAGGADPPVRLLPGRVGASAMDILFPAERHHRPRRHPPAAGRPALADPAAARGWLDAERAILVAVARTPPARLAWPRRPAGRPLYRYLETGLGVTQHRAVTIHTQARRAARQAGDQAGEAHALTTLAS